jgi:hypothetical protein
LTPELNRAVHTPRITLYNEQVQILADIAVSHGYIKEFDLASKETTRLIPAIIRDIIMSYGTMTSTPLYELLDLLITEAVEQKNTDFLEKIKDSSKLAAIDK